MNTKKIKKDRLAPAPRFPNIIVAMDPIDTNPSAPKFHWLLFVQDPPQADLESTAGTKFHATNLVLTAIFETIPLELPAVDKKKEPKFSCRVWVREALQQLHANGHINCPDVDAVERDMVEYANPAISSINNDSFTLATLYTAVNSK